MAQLTRGAIKNISEMVWVGVPPIVAARQLGMLGATFKRHMTRGEKLCTQGVAPTGQQDKLCAMLFAEVDRGQAGYVSLLASNLHEIKNRFGEVSVPTRRWLLKVHEADIYGDVLTIKNRGIAVRSVMSILQARLEPEVYAQVWEALKEAQEEADEEV